MEQITEDERRRMLTQLIRDNSCENCCEDPIAQIANTGCCSILYCDHCRTIWQTNFAEGHNFDHHPQDVMSAEEGNKLRAKRRKTRRNLRNAS